MVNIMVRVKRITNDVERILSDIILLEKENRGFFNEENKTDFNYNIERIKIYLNDTKMVVARDIECEKMVEATNR